MTKIAVEFAPPTNKAQIKALQEIANLNPSKRGREPVLRGGQIYCGRLTLNEVLQRLNNAGISVTKVAIPRGFGSEQFLSVEKPHPNDSFTQSGVQSDETQIKAPEGVIFIGTDEGVMDESDLKYWSHLKQLPEQRAVALHDALCQVTTAANELCPKEGIILQPYHLVDFNGSDDSSSAAVSVNLGRLNKIAPQLTMVIWTHIHNFERDKDTSGFNDQLEVAILDTLCSNKSCDLFSLAQSGVGNDINAT